MKNSVVVGVEFYFKGEKFTPSIPLDLDQFVRSGGGFEELYPTIARQNGIGAYSYEFEMMQAEELTFSEATGIAADYVHDGRLDVEGFKVALSEQQGLEVIRPIAEEHLGVTELNQQPDLKAALLAAYAKGQGSRGS